MTLLFVGFEWDYLEALRDPLRKVGGEESSFTFSWVATFPSLIIPKDDFLTANQQIRKRRVKKLTTMKVTEY